MSYDIKCYTLAREFLEYHPSKDSEQNREILAQNIQTEIEETIEYELAAVDEIVPRMDAKSFDAAHGLEPQ